MTDNPKSHVAQYPEGGYRGEESAPLVRAAVTSGAG
jgi:hypothetical protein